MKRISFVKLIFLLLFAITFTACKGGEAEDEAVGAYAESEAADPLEEARERAKAANPNGKEFVFEDEGIYIMLPHEAWKENSREDGCISFSDSSGIINIYYSDDGGSAYKQAPKSEKDVEEILNKADIPSEWFEILKFDCSEDKDAKVYSYTIKFSVPDDKGEISEFYSVSKSLCRRDKVYVVVGQIYDEAAAAQCETAEESFTVY